MSHKLIKNFVKLLALSCWLVALINYVELIYCLDINSGGPNQLDRLQDKRTLGSDSSYHLASGQSQSEINTNSAQPTTGVAAIIKFTGIKHGHLNDTIARADLQASLERITASRVNIIKFDMSPPGQVIWYSDLVKECSELQLQILLAKISDPRTGKFTRDFKMFIGPDFVHPERVESEWVGACENMGRKRQLAAGIAAADSKPAAVQSDANLNLTESQTSQSPASLTTTTTTTEQATATTTTTTTTTTEPTTTSSTTTTEAPRPTTTTEAPVTTVTETELPPTEMTTTTTTSLSIIEDTTNSTGAAFEEFSFPSMPPLFESTTTEPTTTTTTTPPTTTTLAPTTTTTTTTISEPQPTTTPTTTIAPPLTSTETATDQVSGEESLATNTDIATSGGDTYGKYIGLTTGFFVFIAYALCARAYRRQGMFEVTPI